jgi:uncharacterized protein YegP (UPF0339 family)
MSRMSFAVLSTFAAAAIGIGLSSPTEAQDKDKKAKAAKLTFEIYKDAGESYRWRLKSANGQIIGTSGAGYKDKADCKHGIELVKSGAAKAEVREAAEEK